MSENVQFRCKIDFKIETQWADIVCRVFQNLYYRFLGVVLQVCFHMATLLFVVHGVPAQNRPGLMHQLSEGGMGWLAVHAKHAVRSCGRTIGSPRGTTLVVQPLEVCNTNSETRHTISAQCVSIFKPNLHRNGTFPDMGASSILYLLSPLYNP